MRHRGPAAVTRDRAGPPEERSLTGPRFLGSFPRADVSLAPPLPEIALLGRSNVGKSSLLNALAGRRIAKVSATPGKTRMLNVFGMPAYYLLDLPGYGYARASQTDRRAFRLLIGHALERRALAGVLWLLDIRREPSEDDRAMRERFSTGQIRVLAALTKSDTLARTARARRAQEIREAIELDQDQVIVTSAREDQGIEELREAIDGLVQQAAARRSC
jgi:GTP-binding protein